MSDIINVIDGLEGLVSMQGVSKDEIAVAEKALGLSFAVDYTAYLERYGLASAKHIEITGLEKSKRLNVMDVTLSERQKKLLPADMYVVDNTGIEGILILQNAMGEFFELQNGKAKKIYNNLSEYLKSF